MMERFEQHSNERLARLDSESLYAAIEPKRLDREIEMRGSVVECGTVTRRNGVQTDYMIRHVSMPVVPYLAMMVWAKAGDQDWTLMSMNATAQDARSVVQGWEGH